jgi:hypothetical protein
MPPRAKLDVRKERRDPEERFRRFIAKHKAESAELPLMHITQAYSFRELLRGDCITPKQCPLFNEKLIYFFTGVQPIA